MKREREREEEEGVDRVRGEITTEVWGCASCYILREAYKVLHQSRLIAYAERTNCVHASASDQVGLSFTLFNEGIGPEYSDGLLLPLPTSRK
jgi:hypothetical protein